MAFLRFTRDKRGYEHFQLVQPASEKRAAGGTRILYWFRSPPNIRVGREPFDDAVRSALEKQNPGVEFNWDRILATPIPSGDAERWRERRRRTREARQFAGEDDEEVPVEGTDGVIPAEPDTNVEASSSDDRAQPGRDQERESGRRKRRRRRGRPHHTSGVPAGEPAAQPGDEGSDESTDTPPEADV
jgi:ribonuclease E